MDGLRTQARHRFNIEQNVTRKNEPRGASIPITTVAKFVNAITTIDHDGIPLSKLESICRRINTPVLGSENEKAIATLRIVRFERDSEGVFYVPHQTFMDVFDDFGFDSYWLHMVRAFTYGFFSQYMRGGGLYTCYLHTILYTVLWSYEFKTNLTKVLLIPQTDSNRPEQSVRDLLQTIEFHKDLVDDWRFCSFLCGIQLTRHLEDTIRKHLVRIRKTEVVTKHGAWSDSRPDPPTADKLATKSKTLGSTITALAGIARHASIARAVLKDLASSQPPSLYQLGPLYSLGSNPSATTVDDVAYAIALLEGQIQSSELQAGYLQERGRTQQSVIFNLLAREDTKNSMDIALAARKDSYSMKTIAIMTMIFLPPTFFATFFAMPLLEWKGPKIIDQNLGLYWAVSLPTTALVLLVWRLVSSDKMILAALWKLIMSNEHKKKRNDKEDNVPANMRGLYVVGYP